MVLVHIEAQDVDVNVGANATPVPLFVRCRQRAPGASSGVNAGGSSSVAASRVLQLDVIEGDVLYHSEVDEQHKPLALDCSAREYLRTLETALSATAVTGEAAVASETATAVGAATQLRVRAAFAYKWSRTRGELTLMEQSSAAGFAMKYTSVALVRVVGDSERRARWHALLQDVVDVGAQSAVETTQQRARLGELEARIRAKDGVLDAALRAKQQLEDTLFDSFCAVLNAKKDEIQRLQHALAVAQMQARALESNSSRDVPVSTSSNGTKGGKRMSGKTHTRRRVAKAKGAKLHRGAKRRSGASGDESVDDNDDDTSSSDDTSGSGSDAGAGVGAGNGVDYDDDDASDANELSDVDIDSTQRERGRRAVGVYSQLPSASLSASQVCAADDVLADLGAIMQQEVAAADDTIQDGDSAGADDGTGIGTGRSKRPRAVAPRASAARRTALAAHKKPKRADADAAVAPPASAPVNAAAAAPAPPVKAIDSEEEDILDMLA